MMLNICKKGFVVLFLVACGFWVSAQVDASVYQKMKDKYPEENMVQLSEITEINVSINKGKPVVTRSSKEKYIYINKVSFYDYKRSVYSSSFSELTKYEANSYIFKDGEYKKVKVKDYKEITSSSGGVFYDDSKEYSFTFNGLTDGSVIELNTKHVIVNPKMLSSIIIGSGISVDNFQMVFDVDNRVEIDFIEKNFENSNINYSVEKGKRRTKYIWKAKDIKRIKSESRQLNIRYFVPHIIPIIRSYQTKKGKETVLSNIADLYKWYYSFIKNIDENIDDTELKKIAKEITDSCKTDFEKVENIFSWVQKNINYIAFEDDMGGLVPRKPDEVLRKRYGDCKDYSSIIYELLKYAGVESHLTWIGTRNIPYKYTEVSSPITDNHMILTYIADGKYYFLDGTGEFHYLGLPTYSIQGKQALIAIDSVNFEVVEVPVISAEKNIRFDKVEMELKENKIIGNGIYQLVGYPKISFQYLFIGLKDKKLKNAMENRLEIGNNRFELLDFEISDLESYEPELDVKYNFEIDGYIRSMDDELYLNMNFNKGFLWNKLDKERETPLMFKYQNIVKHEYIFKIPDGYKVDYIPENVSMSNQYFDMEITYSLIGDSIVYKHSFIGKTLVIYPDMFNVWNELIDTLAKSYKKTIVLKKEV